VPGDTRWSRVAERISSELCFRRTVHDGSCVLVTASIGMAWARPAESVDDLLRRADHAMYVAKRDGRARLVVTDDASAR
jgi:diguanylate cyclase (GGDEF)-like protein